MQLDHVGLVTRDLNALRSQWTRLGFAPTDIRELYRKDPTTGEAISLGQRSCHAVFSQSYVELSQVMTTDTAHHLAAWQARGPGLDILALSSATIEADHARLGSGVIALTPLAEATRRIDYGRLQGDAHFRWCMLKPEQTPEGLVCLMAHQTAELVYQPAVQSHPNTAEALEEIVISVPTADLSEMAARYALLLNQHPNVLAGGALRFGLEQGAIVLVAEDQDLNAGVPSGLPRLVGAPHFAALVVSVKDIKRAEGCLLAAGIPFMRQVALTAPSSQPSRASQEQLMIDEAHVGGTRLIFRQARA